MKIHDFTFAFNAINGSCETSGVCYIIAAGKMSELDKSILKTSEFHDNDLIIAADGGLVYFFECFENKFPDVLIGDFDSLDISAGNIASKSFDTEIIKYPVEKDDTDMMLAIKLAFERGYKEFVVFGCIEGEFYHTISNLQSFKYIAERGGLVASVGNGAISVAFSDCEMNISKTASETYKFSVFSLSDKSCGVLIKGGKYSLNDAEITNSFPLGAGNYRNAGENIIIGCKKGVLLTVFNLS